MSLLRSINKSRWDRVWEPTDEVPAKALLDLIRDRDLSVYEVADEESAQKTAIILAANREHIDTMDYALFESADMGTIGITIDESPGSTQNDEVNSLHRDLLDITASKACGLANLIGINGKITRMVPSKVRKLISEYCDQGILDVDKLSEGIRQKILAKR